MAIVATLFSDIHLSHTPPVRRAAEPDWYAAQRRVLEEVSEVTAQYDAVPICAGDIFDRWNASCETINFAIRALPAKLHAIPGQHDLPYHIYSDIRKTAYWTLVEAGVVKNLEYEDPVLVDRFVVYGFPWGSAVGPRTAPLGAMVLAVIHAYVWTDGYGYSGAPVEGSLRAYCERLNGCRIAVFGDNHNGFLHSNENLSVLNCGALIRRKADEMEYAPTIGLLHDDGTITRHLLDTSLDRWTDEAYEERLGIKEIQAQTGLSEFIKELSGLSVDALDFRDAVRRYVNDHDMSNGIKQILLDSVA